MVSDDCNKTTVEEKEKEKKISILENSVLKLQNELKAQKAVIDILLSTGSSSTKSKQETVSPRKENACSKECRNVLPSIQNEILTIKSHNEELGENPSS